MEVQQEDKEEPNTEQIIISCGERTCFSARDARYWRQTCGRTTPSCSRRSGEPDQPGKAQVSGGALYASPAGVGLAHLPRDRICGSRA